MDWADANLEEIREFLLKEEEGGRFKRVSSLPL